VEYKQDPVLGNVFSKIVDPPIIHFNKVGEIASSILLAGFVQKMDAKGFVDNIILATDFQETRIQVVLEVGLDDFT
jgi:hypothetical protein